MLPHAYSRGPEAPTRQCSCRVHAAGVQRPPPIALAMAGGIAATPAGGRLTASILLSFAWAAEACSASRAAEGLGSALLVKMN